VETDFSACSAGSGALGAGRWAHGRHADVWRLLTTCPGRTGIAFAVSSFLFTSGASVTKSQQYSADPFSGIFFPRIGLHLDAPAERFVNSAATAGEIAGTFPVRLQMTTVGEDGRPREACG